MVGVATAGISGRTRGTPGAADSSDRIPEGTCPEAQLDLAVGRQVGRGDAEVEADLVGELSHRDCVVGNVRAWCRKRAEQHVVRRSAHLDFLDSGWSLVRQRVAMVLPSVLVADDVQRVREVVRVG